VQKIRGSSFKTGIQVAEHRRNVFNISTGSKSVDAILGGSSAFPELFINITLNTDDVLSRRLPITVDFRRQTDIDIYQITHCANGGDPS
jgi:hypothetical protein